MTDMLARTASTRQSTLVIDGNDLSVPDVARATRADHQPAHLSDAADTDLVASCQVKRDLIESGQAIYGVTTGFGDSANQQISPAKTHDLQRNLIRYHVNGTGHPASDETVRATLLIRANCLARGRSAVNPEVVRRLLELYNHDVLPVVPERGSVGASGDLVPMCYVASAVVGEGRVRHRGEIRSASDVFGELALAEIELEPKDGLALINGTSFSAAFAVLAIAAAERLATVAEGATALTSEALLGNRGHFAPFIHQNKPHPGQVTSAHRIASMLRDSGLALDHSQVLELNDPLGERGYQRLDRTIQDRYSLRCAPHVIGVLRDTIDWATRWIEIEINSSNDNPLFDAHERTVHSGGNFYGGHVAQAMDALKVAAANVADLLDRQLALLVDEKFNNGLTPNLVPRVAEDDWAAGLHHGFKGMQLACSAITAEALKHTMPASVFSRSTESHNQDKVSMSPIAARDARTVIELVEEVAAIHLLAACQAVELRNSGLMSTATRRIHDLVREAVPFTDEDRPMDGDISRVLGLIREESLPAVVVDPSGH